jgi:SAM-dependent methyltransferase
MTAPVLYDSIGAGYAAARQADPHWQAAILTALDGARSVLNVGAGAGSYEPAGRRVLAVEPSSVMIGQRPGGAAPAVRATAENLPAGDASFDAVMAVMTVHHWAGWQRGLAEMRRVAPLRIVVAADTAQLSRFWLAADYLPELAGYEARQLSAVQIAAELGSSDVRPLPLPPGFTDGMYPAFWCRPDAFLDEDLWQCSSSLARLDPAVRRRAIRQLRADLEDGTWDARHGLLRSACLRRRIPPDRLGRLIVPAALALAVRRRQARPGRPAPQPRRRPGGGDGGR